MFWKQLYLLLWKNAISRKRHWVRTLIEILWPLFLISILVAIRHAQTKEVYSECHYLARALPSAGIYPLLKSFMCDLQNPCFNQTVASEVPGQVNAPLSSNQTSNMLSSLSSLLELLEGNNFTKGGLPKASDLFDANGVPKWGSLQQFVKKGESEYESTREPLFNLVHSFPSLRKSNGSSFFSAAFGSDLTSADGLKKFCGHPLVPTTDSENKNFSSDLNNDFADFSTLNISSPTFCADLLQTLSDKKNPKLDFLFNMFKPFFLGKIPYTPDTPAARLVIKNANSTFETLALIQKFGEDWQNSVGPKIYQEMDNGTRINYVRKILNSEEDLEKLAEQGNVSVEQLTQLRMFLSNTPNDHYYTWKEAFHEIDKTIALVTKLLECSELDKFVAYDDEEELVRHSIALVDNKTLLASVVFLLPDGNSSELPKIVKYKIRQDSRYVTETTRLRFFVWRPGAFSNEIPSSQKITDTPVVHYFTGGFVHVQDMIENAIILTKADERGLKWAAPFTLGNYLQEMPYPCYTEDLFLQFLSVLFSLLMTLAWIYSVCTIIKNVVYEKEKRLKEVMKMMGLSNGVHWVAWFINSFAVMFVSMLLLLILLRNGRILPNSNLFIILIWLVCFACATISQCFLVSCFFNRANLAAACGGIIFFVLYIPYNVVFVFQHQITYPVKLLACLLSSVAFGYGAGYMSKYEISGDGIQFHNWAKSYDPDDEMNFLTSMVMMLVDAGIYLTLTWYIENVFPGTYGVPKRWNFFMHASYWTGRPMHGYQTLDDSSESDVDHSVKLEKEPTHLTMGVSMHRLRKVFDNCKVAVNNLTLRFYEGQITSFLGHNGAGKTTTMSMLTGLFSPTSGTATIYGYDIQTQMDQARRQLGFCPQHNVLFGDLTVLEHLRFYAGLKNAAGAVAEDKDEIEQMLQDVGLPQKRHEISRHLSGGMKRKLSVAIAFVGGSKCVILDEPTAGVDPYARRGIWDLLLRYRDNRTILLSTHHMDEADLLGDRIAIISHGQLKCCGSSLFLKSTYGIGYYLTVVKKTPNNAVTDGDKERAGSHPVVAALHKDHSDSARSSDEGFGSSSDISLPASSTFSTPVRRRTVQIADFPAGDCVNKLVFSFISQAKVQEDNQREVTFVLPYSAQADGRYCKLFEKLDERGLTYGLTDTSLEEIFMKVAEQNVEEQKEEEKNCCFCIPRRTKSIPSPAPESPDGQARRGTLRSTRSMTSNFSGISSSPLISQLNQADDDDDVEMLTDIICDVDAVDRDDDDLFTGISAPPPQEASSRRVKGRQLVLQQFLALFVKRFHHFKRNRKGLIAQIIVPSGFVALGLLCSLAAPIVTSYPPLELQPWLYGNTYTFYSNDRPTSNSSTSQSKALLDPPSIGMRCVQDYRVLDNNGIDLTCDHGSNVGVWSNDSDIGGYSQGADSNRTLVCRCTTNSSRVLLADCPLGAGGSPTPRALTETFDHMYNMSGRNLSDWLVKTVDRFIEKRYGGLSFGENFYASVDTQQLTPLVRLAKQYSDFNLSESTGRVLSVPELAQNLARYENAKIWFDNNGFHSMPTWLNVKSNAALRSMLNNATEATEHGIVAINHPLNFTRSSLDAAARSSAVKYTLVSVCVIFALSFIPASFVLFLIDEKVTKSKHLQFVSGVNPVIYWLSSFAWDLINYMFSITVVILIFFMFQTKAYVSAENFPCLLSLLFFYGFSMIPMMYPASFYYEVPSTAYVALTCINIFIGINASLITFILKGLSLPYLKGINHILEKAFLIFPQYCLGHGLIDMAVEQSYADALSSITGSVSHVEPFNFKKVGRNLLVMSIEGVFFFLITLAIQYKYFTKPCGLKRSEQIPSRTADEDCDIVAERRRIIESSSDDILKIRNLSKVYKKRGAKSHLVAVDKLCVGVPRGECFGLLGVNGAGKTTTFKMLTGDTAPTAGDAHVCGQSILDNLREVQQNTGYCPQFEALNGLLTAREHLIFYAKLRGVTDDQVSSVAEWAINKFNLAMYADKPAGTYSGGNKRKLSAAIAFIGSPPIIFLDEPTAGMDPMARRFLWSRIIEAVRGGRSVVLTSHSMEECEALCTRLAIMVNGRLKCIGSPQHLKNRYGEGYTIAIKIVNSKANMERLQVFMKSRFKKAILKESHCNMLIYQVPFEDVQLSKLFVALENVKKSMFVEDYSINQTTLDEVFVNFAKNQTGGSEDEYGFQPLTDDMVVDYSQLQDRARELSNGNDIALYNLTGGGQPSRS